MVSGALIGFYLHDFGERDSDKKDLEEDEWREKIRNWEQKWMMS